MGRLPGYVDGGNAVLQMWQNPCGADWSVWIEAAKAPAGKAILQLLEFDFCDLLRCIFRPAGLPVGTKRRRGRRGKGGIPGPLGIPEFLCERFVRDPDFAKRPVTSGTRALWHIDGVLQKGLFWFMIADVTDEFLYNWMSLVQRSEACSFNYAGSATGTVKETTSAPNQAWVPLTFENLSSFGTCGWPTSSVVSCTGLRLNVAGSAFAKRGPLWYPGATYQTRIVIGTTTVWESEQTQPDLSKPDEGLVSPLIKEAAGSVQLQARVVGSQGTAGVYDFTGGSLSVVDTTSPPAFEPYEWPSANDFLCFPGAINSLL